MVGWHDRRRDLFFDSLRPGIYVDRAAIDQVVMAEAMVRVRDGAPIGDIRRQLSDLQPRLRGKKLYFGRTPAHGSAASVAVQTCPDYLDPIYVFVAQQRVQPGTDPEYGAPLPRPPKNSELGRGVKIAVVDTGIGNQPGAHRVWSRPLPAGNRDTLYDTRTPKPNQKLAWAAGHGTFVGSLIRQVAPAAEIIPIRACSPMGYETEDDVASGIERAVAKGVHIINLSWCSYAFVANGTASSNHEPVRLRSAVKKAVDKGVVVVAAAGNSASPDRMYPAAWPNVLAVGALGRDGRRWDHSNYGSWVDAWALGDGLRGVYVKGEENPANDPDGHAEIWDDPEINYATWTGTSFSTPLVAAQIANVSSATGRPAREAQDILLQMSHEVTGVGGGKRIMVDIPGQT
jgi:subtilisin family serine protease